MKRILVLGGTSSIAKPFLKLALTEGYEVTATTRDSKNSSDNSRLHWESLNLDSKQSVHEFINSINQIEFDFIFDFIGKTSGFDLQDFDSTSLEQYFNAQITNHVYLLLKIQKQLVQNGSLINISSRSVEHGSFDIPYAISKASIHQFVFSTRNRISKDQNVVNVVSGLIQNSTMFNEMSLETKTNHQHRASAELITVENFVIELFKLCKDLEDGKYTSYALIKIGPDYE